MVYTCIRILFSLKKYGNPSHAITWMNLEDIMLSEITQSQTNTVRFHLCEVPRVVKFIEPESRMVVRGVWCGGKGELLSNGYR